MDAAPEEVLEVLTEPESCVRWSPVPFELDGLSQPHLVTGTRGRLGGRLVGRKVDFDLEILHADERRLELRASGPVNLEAVYDATPAGQATQLRAAVSVRPGPGLSGRLAARATEALLAAGALDRALERIAEQIGAATSRPAMH
jgi:hypothetical protein